MKKFLLFFVLYASCAYSQTVSTDALILSNIKASVNGTFIESKSKFISNPNIELPSGFYTTTGSVNVPDANTSSIWYFTVNHHQNSQSTYNSTGYQFRIWSKLGSNDIYKQEVNNGTYGNFFQLYDTNVFKTGKSIQNGNATITEFTIVHGFSSKPIFVNVQAGSSDARSIAWVDWDATNIYVKYATAPPSGTTNLIFCWSAKL